jgi:hypothetical protein
LVEIWAFKYTLSCFFDQISEPIILKRGQLFEDKDRIVLLSAPPNEFLQFAITEDDEVVVGLKQLREVVKIELEGSLG